MASMSALPVAHVLSRLDEAMKLLHLALGSDSRRQVWRNMLGEELVCSLLCLPELDNAPSSIHRVRRVQYDCASGSARG